VCHVRRCCYAVVRVVRLVCYCRRLIIHPCVYCEADSLLTCHLHAILLPSYCHHNCVGVFDFPPTPPTTTTTKNRIPSLTFHPLHPSLTLFPYIHFSPSTPPSCFLLSYPTRLLRQTSQDGCVCGRWWGAICTACMCVWPASSTSTSGMQTRHAPASPPAPCPALTLACISMRLSCLSKSTSITSASSLHTSHILMLRVCMRHRYACVHFAGLGASTEGIEFYCCCCCRPRLDSGYYRSWFMVFDLCVVLVKSMLDSHVSSYSLNYFLSPKFV